MASYFQNIDMANDKSSNKNTYRERLVIYSNVSRYSNVFSLHYVIS